MSKSSVGRKRHIERYLEEVALRLERIGNYGCHWYRRKIQGRVYQIEIAVYAGIIWRYIKHQRNRID